MHFRLASVAVLLAAATAAHADSITLTLSNPAQTGTAGSTFSYNATVFAPTSNTGVEYLNGDSYSYPIGGSLDDSGFLNNFPLSLNPGQSYTGTLFTFTLPTSAKAGTLYGGQFSILGGSSVNSSSTIATVTYSATTPAIAATPEPPPALLLGTALLGVAFLVRRSSTTA